MNRSSARINVLTPPPGYATSLSGYVSKIRCFVPKTLTQYSVVPLLSSNPFYFVRRYSQMTVFADRMRVALSVLAHVQIVTEKIAGQYGGERRRRQTITYVETLKAISRLILLACTKEMVIGGGKVRFQTLLPLLLSLLRSVLYCSYLERGYIYFVQCPNLVVSTFKSNIVVMLFAVDGIYTVLPGVDKHASISIRQRRRALR